MNTSPSIWLLTAVIVAVCFTFFNQAHAAQSMHDGERLYIVTAIGTSANTDYDVYHSSTGAPAVTNDSIYTSYRVGVGFSYPTGHWVSLGLEVAYNDYGQQTYDYLDMDSAKAEFSAYDVLAVADIHMTSTWSTKFRLGVAYEEVDVTEDSLSADLSEREWVPEVGIGINYALTDHIAIEGSFDYLVGEVSNIDDCLLYTSDAADE